MTFTTSDSGIAAPTPGDMCQQELDNKIEPATPEPEKTAKHHASVKSLSVESFSSHHKPMTPDSGCHVSSSADSPNSERSTKKKRKEFIKFIPELPQRKLDGIKRLGFGLLDKVAMLFPHVFWEMDLDRFGHLSDDPSCHGEFFLLISLVAGEDAHKFESMPPVEL
ncbi:hypothetical protein KIW84_021512 [Lathyrus oleraceus]|uniref:Amine oxidase domain-containing protein n=1 Tax=Pisum sativum TaxID=3888 RepID=A0A9D4Y8G0_PEA|nr:hypothetical protein KIW84_021512 [Pisum sativum]